MTLPVVLPEPLTPVDCDLRSMHWFPLHHQNLQRSTFWLKASDLVARRSVDLWIEAYQQVPAGSLPADDAILAKHAGFGRDVAGFMEIKPEIMAPWVLCSDGRYYHPTLCEIAMETWLTREAYRLRERTKKRKQREKSHGDRNTPAGDSDGENGIDIQVEVKEQVEGDSVGSSESTVGDAAAETLPVVAKPKADKRGSRIPFGWTANPAERDFATAKGYDPDQTTELEDGFYDFWKARAGKDGVKLDWTATWRTWVRNDIKFNGKPNERSHSGGRSAPDHARDRHDARTAALHAGAAEALARRGGRGGG